MVKRFSVCSLKALVAAALTVAMLPPAAAQRCVGKSACVTGVVHAAGTCRPPLPPPQPTLAQILEDINASVAAITFEGNVLSQTTKMSAPIQI